MHQAGLAAAAALPSDTEGATQPVATPEGTATEQGATAPADTPTFTKLDPNALPPEVRPYYDSMLADYTRKTQEIAPTRQLQSELGLDGDGLRQAAELYSALQDPEQLVSFYNELQSALQANGLTPAQAEAAATEHIQSTLTPGADDAAMMDPEERRIADMEGRLARFEQQQATEQQTRQREQQQMALVAEMNRQESIVREQFPDWNQEDIETVYRMAPGYGGSLVDAAANLAEYTSARVARILNGKGAVASNAAHGTLPPAMSGVTRPMGFGDDLDAAHRAALEAARQLP
jgi:hypothetical protein